MLAPHETGKLTSRPRPSIKSWALVWALELPAAPNANTAPRSCLVRRPNPGAIDHHGSNSHAGGRRYLAVYRTLSLLQSSRQVLGPDLNRSESSRAPALRTNNNTARGARRLLHRGISVSPPRSTYPMSALPQKRTSFVQRSNISDPRCPPSSHTWTLWDNLWEGAIRAPNRKAGQRSKADAPSATSST